MAAAKATKAGWVTPPLRHAISVRLLAASAASATPSGQSARASSGTTATPWPAAALTVVPYYSRPGEAGVLEHFRTLAASSPVPLLIYNIPYRTGQAVRWQTMQRLAEMPGIAGVKHAAGSIDQDTIALMAGRPAGFSVLGGDDLYISPLLALGADGGILASAHVRTAESARLVSLWRDGRAGGRGQAARAPPCRVSQALFAEPNPVAIKAVLHRLGQIPSPAVRLPLLPASDAATDAAAACVAAG